MAGFSSMAKCSLKERNIRILNAYADFKHSKNTKLYFSIKLKSEHKCSDNTYLYIIAKDVNNNQIVEKAIVNSLTFY